MLEVLFLIFLQEILMKLFLPSRPSRPRLVTVSIFLVINLIVMLASMVLYSFQREFSLYEILDLPRGFTQSQLRKAVVQVYPHDRPQQIKMIHLLSHPRMVAMYDKYQIKDPQQAVSVSNQSMMYQAVIHSAISYGVFALVALWSAQVARSKIFVMSTLLLAFIQEVSYYEQPLLSTYDLFDLLPRPLPIFQRIGYIHHFTIVFTNFIKSCFNMFYVPPEDQIYQKMEAVAAFQLKLHKILIQEHNRMQAAHRSNPDIPVLYSLDTLLLFCSDSTVACYGAMIKGISVQQFHKNRQQNKKKEEQNKGGHSLLVRVVIFLTRMYLIGLGVQFVVNSVQWVLQQIYS